MRLETPGQRRRRRFLDSPLPQPWRDVLARRVPQWDALDGDEREVLEELTKVLLVDKRWEAARGFDLTDEMRVTIAGNAALLGLALGLDAYRGVGAIVVHRSTVRLRGERPVGVAGAVTDVPMPALGHAQLHGPVVLAWNAVARDVSRPGRGSNVVHHEFAHKLDMLDGYSDGMPPLAGALRARWTEVRDRELARLRHVGPTPALRAYAGENEAELFAVATEAFFDVPYLLAEHHPELYPLLCDVYQQEPLRRPSWYWPVRQGDTPDG